MAELLTSPLWGVIPLVDSPAGLFFIAGAFAILIGIVALTSVDRTLGWLLIIIGFVLLAFILVV